MPELLLELLSEEIPARMQRRAAADLKRLVTDGLTAARLDFTSAESYVTPRRLVLVVDGLPERQPDLREERKGPKVGAPDKAIAGFKRSLQIGVEIEERETEKGTFLYAIINKTSRPTKSVVTELIVATLNNFSWPKSMRWGHTIFTWVRPLHEILAVFDGQPLIQNFGRGVRNASDKGMPTEDEYPIKFSNTSRGHRFHSPDPFLVVTGFDEYRDNLHKAYVILDPADRRKKIASELARLAQAEGLTVKDDPGLLDEVTGLVEWPVPLLGDIDADFMDLPAEALTSSMRAHQKYFSLLKRNGSLAPRFGFVANIETADGGKAIIAGNERVLRARLADAKFFWDQDRKTPLADRAQALEAIVFHAKLGSVAAKTRRIAALAAYLAGEANADEARRAALLCKADLVTGMVAEFPDLQGAMGRYYALADGESPAVAAAIADHYAPQGPNDACPSAPVSVAVALADKIDTLIGFWAIDEKPTGSRDPYALRRSALGVIRLILENELTISLRSVFDRGKDLYQKMGVVDDDFDWTTVLEGLRVFVFDRLKFYLRERGVRHDLIDALLGSGNEDDLLRAVRKSEALKEFLDTEDGSNLLVAYRRAANIVRIERKKDKSLAVDDVIVRDLVAPEEKELWKTLSEIESHRQDGNDIAAYRQRLGALAELRDPVDQFFDGVKVNVDEDKLRRNRLNLLSKIQTCMNGIADFSQIEG